MKQGVLKLARLALCATIAPALLAQNSGHRGDHGSQPGTELIAWTQVQQLEPLPYSQQQQAERHRVEAQDSDQRPTPGQQDDMQKQSATQTFVGTILKSGNQYLLRTPDNVTYQLDDQARAKKYEGKPVQVIGSPDEASGTIHVEDMKGAA